MTPKKKRFCNEWLRTGSQLDAYRKAYDCTGMLSKTISESASRLARQDVVRAFMDQHFAKTSELAGVTRQRVIRRAADLAFADVRDLYDAHGKLKPVNALTKRQAAMLAGIEVTRDVIDDVALGWTETVKVKLVNPVAAVAQLGKFLGMDITKTQDVTRGGQFVITLED